MKILVIEDDRPTREFLKATLQAECYAVDTAADGEEGLSLALGNPYDLILLDNQLPRRDGGSVCESLRAQKNVVPILVLSVRTSPATKSELLDLGADDYLSKPFSVEELMARIRALLRRPLQLEGDRLILHPFVLDTKAHTLHRGDTEIHLTRKEFMLFEYLLRNQGTVLSRSMILEHVWDMNADPFSNTIESHILALRRKIGCTSTRRIIQTISGMGYKIG